MRTRSSESALTRAANDGLAGIESLPTKHDVARRYQVSVRTIDRWCRLVPYIKFGPRCVRFRWPDVERAVARLTIEEIQ
jgi:hypothetical protein